MGLIIWIMFLKRSREMVILKGAIMHKEIDKEEFIQEESLVLKPLLQCMNI